MLSFGGLLSEIVGGGSGGINASNPGIVKFFSGAVFPVGLIMYVDINHPPPPSPRAVAHRYDLHPSFSSSILPSHHPSRRYHAPRPNGA